MEGNSEKSKTFVIMDWRYISGAGDRLYSLYLAGTYLEFFPGRAGRLYPEVVKKRLGL